METFKLHPTGRSEERNLIRQELSQDSKAVTKSQRVKLGRRGLTKTHSVYGILLNVCESVLYRFQGSVTSEDCGGLAQLVERLPCKQEVSGSTPLISTTYGSLAQSVRALA